MITVWLILQVIVFAFVLVTHLRAYKFSVFHPTTIYLAFHFLVFVLHPILVYALRYNNNFLYMDFFPDDAEVGKTLAITDFGLICFVAIGWWASGTRRPEKSFPARPDSKVAVSDLQRRAFYITAAILGPISLAALIYNFTHPIIGLHNGGVESITLTRDAASGKTLFTDSSAYVVDLQYMAATLSLVWAYLHRFKLVHLLPFGIYVFFRAAAGGGRFSFILLALAFGLAFLMQRHLLKPNFRMVAVGIAVFALFAVVGNDRGLVRKSLGIFSSVELSLESNDQNSKKLEDIPILNGPDFGNYEFLSYVVHHVPYSFGTYTYFTQYLDLLVKPIPRVLWPEKPANNLIETINLNTVGNFSGLTVSLVGDGWMSLGWPGIFLTMSFASWLCHRFYSRFLSGDLSIYRTMSYCVFLGLTPQWFRDGQISIVEFILAFLAPLFVWAVIERIIRGGATRQPYSRAQRVLSVAKGQHGTPDRHHQSVRDQIV